MNDIKAFIQQIKKIVVDTITPILKNYPRIVSASVISINDRLATVRMPYETDASKDFKAYVVTSQLVSIGDVVNVAYWSNLSTAVVLSNTSTVGASGGGTTNYNLLENKPSINGVTLTGNKTSSDISVAPDGYGLGTTPKLLTSSDDLNNLGGRSGWYYWGDSKPQNAPSSYCTMRVDGGYNLVGHWCKQTVTYGGPEGTTYYRHMTDRNNGTWGEWEWVNPPLNAGTEYRTTERWNGYPVYAQMISCGTMPQTVNGIKSIETNISANFVVRSSGYMTYYGMLMPFDVDGKNWRYVVLNGGGRIMLISGESVPNINAYVFITMYYTKAT